MDFFNPGWSASGAADNSHYRKCRNMEVGCEGSEQAENWTIEISRLHRKMLPFLHHSPGKHLSLLGKPLAWDGCWGKWMPSSLCHSTDPLPSTPSQARVQTSPSCSQIHHKLLVPTTHSPPPPPSNASQKWVSLVQGHKVICCVLQECRADPVRSLQAISYFSYSQTGRAVDWQCQYPLLHGLRNRKHHKNGDTSHNRLLEPQSETSSS